MAHNFPALLSASEDVNANILKIMHGVNVAPDQYMENAATDVKRALEAYDKAFPSLRDAPDLDGMSKNSAIHHYAGSITSTLWELAKRISSVYKTTPPSAATGAAIKSVLEKLEDTQGPPGLLAQENNVDDFDKTYPGIELNLADDLEEAYKTLGGR